MDHQQRLSEASSRAKDAEARGNDGLAAAEWRRYRLIEDTARDPEDLLTEGIALSVQAIELAAASR
jgi:negative regulator of sigma E activity